MVVDDSRFSSTKAFETTQSIKERTNDEEFYIFLQSYERILSLQIYLYPLYCCPGHPFILLEVTCWMINVKGH